MFVLVCDWFDNDLVLMVVCINISSHTCMKYVKLCSFAFLCLSSWVGSRTVAMFVLVCGCFDDAFFFLWHEYWFSYVYVYRGVWIA